MAVYIVADLMLSYEEAAEKFNLSIDQYNKRAIENINSIVEEDDWILFFGKLSNDSITNTKGMLNQIKGNKYLLDRYEQYKFAMLSKEEWKDLGFNHVYGGYVGLVSKSIVEGEKYEVYIDVLKKTLKSSLENKEKKYIGTCQSKYKMDKIFDGKLLDLSFGSWDMSPIEYDYLGQIIADQKLFESMKTE